MKKLIYPFLLLLMALGTNLKAQDQQDYLGLPGDNLNLFAVLKLFQESPTLEAFERDLNDENSHINNLDLDGDGQIDYIRVIDHVDGNYHSIVLQVALGPRETQDVAVFTVHRDNNGHVDIQLTGDEALYGRNYIIEPNYADLDEGTPNPGYSDYRTVNGERVVVNRTTTVEVGAWPLIRFMFLPTYIIWHSPWYYNYYPSYWHPWRPYYWHYYYGYHYNWDPYYYGHYRIWHEHHDNYWNDSYYSQRRTFSPVVTTRIQSGSYRSTYSHPEARNEGYNMYYKVHPDQQARRSDRTISDPVAGRSEVNTNTRQQYDNGSRRRSNSETRVNTRSNGTTQPQTRTTTTERKTETRTTTSGTSRRTDGATRTERKTTDKSTGIQGQAPRRTETRRTQNGQGSTGTSAKTTRTQRRAESRKAADDSKKDNRTNDSRR
jgi:hypothetical protein